MNRELKNSGFSLTEVLLAVGTLAIGMVFIGGTFLAGIHFSTISTERTIAAVAADEAFAKIKIIVADPYCPIDANAFDLSNLESFEERVNTIRVNNGLGAIDPKEFTYPSTDTSLTEKQYFWSALCRRTDTYLRSNLNPPVQVTVFVSRKVGSGAVYRDPLDPEGNTVGYPMPVPVNVSGSIGNKILTIQDQDRITWINDGYTIVENTTGKIYRVIERGADPDYPDRITLDVAWQGSDSVVWVIPPPASGGRYPCIAIYQGEIRF